MSVLITKSDGEAEPFDSSKLTRSLVHAGAAKNVAEAIANDIERDLWSGISTREIYSRAFARLREHRKGVAARYSLKRSVMEFGPSGFPFEIFVSELFRAEGYETQVDQIVQGACVEHEVDVVIYKKEQTVYAEAKFHNTVGFKTDLKTVLYIQARIFDIKEEQRAKKREERAAVSGLVVTNTKFTDKALQYAQCQGLEVLGWDNPSGATLHERIEKSGLYPITALTSLTSREKMALLSKKVVLCRSLYSEGSALRDVGITGRRADEVLEEAGALCYPKKDIQ